MRTYNLLLENCVKRKHKTIYKVDIDTKAYMFQMFETFNTLNIEILWHSNVDEKHLL